MASIIKCNPHMVEDRTSMFDNPNVYGLISTSRFNILAHLKQDCMLPVFAHVMNSKSNRACPDALRHILVSL